MMLALGGLAACIPASGGLTAFTLPPQTLRFTPSRDDVTVRAAWMQFRCVMPSGGATYRACPGFTVNGRPVDIDTAMLEFPATGRNTAEMGRVDVSFAGEGSHLCIALRAIFNEVPHDDDVGIFAVSRDRASLLSYCTVEVQPDQVPNRYPFEQNRVRSLKEFVERLSRPIEVRLRTGPLPRQP